MVFQEGFQEGLSGRLSGRSFRKAFRKVFQESLSETFRVNFPIKLIIVHYIQASCTTHHIQSIMQPPLAIKLRIVRPPGDNPTPKTYKFLGYGEDKHDQVLVADPCTPLQLPTDNSSGKSSFSKSSKTKKNKVILSASEKAKLWEIFDMEKNIEVVEDDSAIPVAVPIPSSLDPSHTDLRSSSRQSVCLPTTDTSNSTLPPSHKCDLCDNFLIITEEGFPTCTNPHCGRICRDILDYSPEWRFFGGNDRNAVDTTRCGNPINPLLMESSFGCKILCDNHSSYEMKKIRKWTEWQSTPHREKSLYEEFQFITIMAQNAGIPKIFIDYAMVIHKDISEQKMFRGMNRDGIKAASIYISCRLNGCPRTAHEIAEIFKLDKQSTTYGCSMAVNILNNIERNMDPSQKTELGTTTPSAFIDRYCSRLNIMNELAILAKFVAQKVENNSIVCDNTPQSTAAGIVYFVSQICKLGISKTDIKNICGVSEVTINKCFKKLFSIQGQLVPKCILDKYSA
jgi:transcription initiation factor TFIIB